MDPTKLAWYLIAVERQKKNCNKIRMSHVDLCYNFNPQHNIDYGGHIVTTCSSYGGELLRIDSQERQTYMEHILGRHLATTGTTIKHIDIASMK
jgi:hypothetical protein